MSEVLILIFCLLAGAALGTFFFVGLWWTVRIGVSLQNPAFLFLASQLVRTGSVLFAFYYLSQGHWTRLLCGFIGFLISREVIKRLAPQEMHRAA